MQSPCVARTPCEWDHRIIVTLKCKKRKKRTSVAIAVDGEPHAVGLEREVDGEGKKENLNGSSNGVADETRLGLPSPKADGRHPRAGVQLEKSYSSHHLHASVKRERERERAPIW